MTIAIETRMCKTVNLEEEYNDESVEVTKTEKRTERYYIIIY